MINLSAVVNNPDLTYDITIQRATGGYLDKSVYKTDPPTRFIVTGVFDPDSLKEITPTPEGSRGTGSISFMCNESVELYTTHNLADGNDISDQIILNPGASYEAAYRIVSVNAAYGIRVVQAQRVGAV